MHTLKVEAAAWFEGASRVCEQCPGEDEHVQNEVHGHLFHLSSTYCFFCLARCGFRILPSFRWDALWSIYITLPYLEWGARFFILPGPLGLWAEEVFFLLGYTFFENFSTARPNLLQQVKKQLVQNFLSQQDTRLFPFLFKFESNCGWPRPVSSRSAKHPGWRSPPIVIIVSLRRLLKFRSDAPWGTYNVMFPFLPCNLLLSCNNNTPPTAGWGKNYLKKRRQMRWLDSLTIAAQRCTNWWLQLNVLTSLPFLLSHGLSTFTHILCNPRKVLLT